MFAERKFHFFCKKAGLDYKTYLTNTIQGKLINDQTHLNTNNDEHDGYHPDFRFYIKVFIERAVINLV